MLEQFKLDPQTHIFRISVTRESYKHIYMATPLSVLKKAKNGTLPEKNNGATGLKLWNEDMK